MSKKKYRSDFLFPRTGFFMGICSTYNLPGNYYRFNVTKTAEEADYKAIQSDWGAIGGDIKKTVDANPPQQM